MHFPANAGLMFLTNKLTNDRYLVDTGATLSIVPCNQNSSPSGPLLKGADGQPIPSWGFIQKTVQFQGKLLTSTFLQAAVAGPVLGIDFLRKLKVIVSPEISWRFSHIHVDLVGPLQYSNSFNYIFTIIDRMSKWMEAIPLSETSAAACTKALTFTWISHLGVPETITSDRGPQFTSNLWFHLCEMLSISHKQTIAYHPESNGAVKRLHRRLKDALRARAAAATWSEELTFVLLGPRAQLRGRHWSFPS
jgi:hypothetical protein